MKDYWIYLLILITALSGGALLLLPDEENPPPKQDEVVEVVPEPIVEEAKAPVVTLKPVERLPEPVKEPEPIVIEAKVAEAPKPAPPKKKTPAPTRLSEEERRRMAINRYYDHMERNFSSKQNQLNRETDPARRDQLIQSLARHVRVDTLDALDWAATLEDPAEKRTALEAINENALTGIGARIEMDERGVPKIKDTTILSAVDSTGMVQPGDYISGMVTADGTTVSFKGMNMREIVNHLRGQPGSNIQLQMERSPEYGSTQPIPFNVPVQRSLIVMERPN